MKPFLKTLILLLPLVAGLARSGQAVDCDQAIKDVIVSDYNLDTASYEIEILTNRLKSIEVEPDKLTYTLVSRKEPLGLFTILATVDLGNGQTEKGQIRMRISKFDNVLVTIGRMGRHEQLAESKVMVKRMDVTTISGRPVRKIEELTNCRARKIIRKDQILTLEAIESIPDIEVGKDIKIVLAEQLLQITAPGRSLQSGSVGEFIKVKNQATGKVLKARVVDAHSVAVDI